LLAEELIGWIFSVTLMLYYGTQITVIQTREKSL